MNEEEPVALPEQGEEVAHDAGDLTPSSSPPPNELTAPQPIPSPETASPLIGDSVESTGSTANSTAPGLEGPGLAPLGPPSHHEKYPFSIDLVDPLFAVALHLGIADGLVHFGPFHEWRLPVGNEVFDLAVFGLGFWNLILGWLGYHRSIKKKPLRALGRFLIDVTLVMSYGLILIKFESFDAVLQMMIVVFVLYIVWDLFKIAEYHHLLPKDVPFLRRYRRELVTCFWCLVFLTLWLLHSHHLLGREPCLAFAYLSLLGYRINKEIEIWSHFGRAVVHLMFRGEEMP